MMLSLTLDQQHPSVTIDVPPGHDRWRMICKVAGTTWYDQVVLEQSGGPDWMPATPGKCTLLKKLDGESLFEIRGEIDVQQSIGHARRLRATKISGIPPINCDPPFTWVGWATGNAPKKLPSILEYYDSLKTRKED